MDTPAEERAAFGAFLRNFRPDIAVRKFYKIKPAIVLTGGQPQSPATRVFLGCGGAIGFENLQNFRYLYALKCRCTNDFTAIY